MPYRHAESADHGGRDSRQELSERLKKLKEYSGLSYAEIAEKTGVSVSTLKRGVAGTNVPKLTTVVDFAGACGGTAQDEAEIRMLWRAARRAPRANGRTSMPNPQYIKDKADLSGALVKMYHWAGAPTLREMQDRASAFNVLPHSQAHRIVRGETLPCSRAQFIGYLKACEIPEEMHEAWLHVWDKVMAKGPQAQVADTMTDFVLRTNSGENGAGIAAPAIMGRRLARIWRTMTKRERRAALRAFTINLPNHYH
ncbi:helix-turn-helix transcriptional regulator [Streptomyces luteireticuli]